MRSDTFQIEKLVRKNIAKLKPYSSAKSEFKDFKQDLIFLDANENPYENGWNRYPDPDQEELKNILSKVKGISVKNMLLGNGSDEILDMIFRVFCDPKVDSIIINTPTFGMYKVLADINEIAVKYVSLTNDFQLNTDFIKKQIDEHTKLIFICSPNNPTGNLISKKDILYLLQTLHIMIVIDEAYIDFSDELSWLHEVENYKNLIVIQTLSKAYGMAGLRLGICYAAEATIEVLKKIKMPYNVNVLSQKMALEQLNEQRFIETKIDEILVNRSVLKNDLQKISFVKKIYHSDTNFLLVKVDDASKRYKQLLEKGIVVRNRSNEPLCENCLRFTIGTKEEIEILINTLKILNK